MTCRAQSCGYRFTSMKMNILGASGSGVTTMGQSLAGRWHVPYVDSDDYFWEKTEPPFTTKRDPQLRNQMIHEELSKNKDWILGGSVINWGDKVFPDFDVVVFLYIPSDIRIKRLKRRELTRYGEVIHTNPTRREHFEQFILWASDYDHNAGVANRTLHAHEAWLATQKAPIIRLIGDITTQERVRLTIEKLNEFQLIGS